MLLSTQAGSISTDATTHGGGLTPAKLCAAFSSSLPRAELQALVQRMVAAYGFPPGQLQLVADLPLGVVAGPPGGLATGCDAQGRPAFRAAAAGEIRSACDAAQRLDPPLAAGYGTCAPALAAALLRRHGPAALHRLNDVFALVVADLDAPRAWIANDRFGSMPLFYLIREDLLLVASEVKCIAAVAPLQHDPAAYGQFFYIGHLLRNQTLYREVKALGPGQMIEWEPSGGAVRTYWDVTHLPTAGAEYAPLHEINDVLNRAIGRAVRPGCQDTLLLSGGLDSRLILAVLLNQGRKPKGLTLEHAGFAGGIDGRLAREVAAIAGIELDFRPTRPRFHQSADALDVFCISDGMAPSLGLFISQVYPELHPTMERVWEGVAIGQSLGHMQVGDSLRSNLSHFTAARALNRRYLQRFLQPDWFNQIEELFERELAAEVERYPDTEDGWVKFQMVNRNRRRVGMPPHHQYSRKVIALTPGLDAELVEFMFGVSLRQRRHCRLYGQLLLQYYPLLAQTPTHSTEHTYSVAAVAEGAMGAGAHRTASLRDAAKKLGLSPYLRAVQFRLGKVEQSKLDSMPSEVVSKTLRTTGFDRPIYRRAQIERALRKVERGSIYWLNALAPILYIELWHCLNDPAALDVLRSEVFTA